MPDIPFPVDHMICARAVFKKREIFRVRILETVYEAKAVEPVAAGIFAGGGLEPVDVERFFGRTGVFGIFKGNRPFAVREITPGADRHIRRKDLCAVRKPEPLAFRHAGAELVRKVKAHSGGTLQERIHAVKRGMIEFVRAPPRAADTRGGIDFGVIPSGDENIAVRHRDYK